MRRNNLILIGVVFALMIIMPLNVSASAVKVQYHGPAEIKQYMIDKGVAFQYPVSYIREPDNANHAFQGEVAQDTLSSALRFTNFIRHIAGIRDNVLLDDKWNYYAQCAAYVCAKNGGLSHGWYDEELGDLAEDALDGCSSSNLAISYSDLNNSIIQYMSDSDESNIGRVGHRRWVLFPELQKTGFGVSCGVDFNNYCAMCVFDNWFNDDGSEYGESLTESFYGVAWPSENMPTELFNRIYPWNDAWSISFGTVLDSSRIRVVLKNINNGQSWNFTSSGSNGDFYVDNGGFGQQGCVIFRPEGIDSYNNGDIYEVTISGIGNEVVPNDSYTYRVNFFSLDAIQPSAGKDIGEAGDMYRLYNKHTGEHFYTNNIIERDHLVIVGWNYEDVSWNAPTDSGDAVYRLYNPNSGDHHYTINASERDMLMSVGWSYEGEAWKSKGENGTPVYRLYNPNASTGSHHYTTNKDESRYLSSIGWKDEGIGWYGN